MKRRVWILMIALGTGFPTSQAQELMLQVSGLTSDTTLSFQQQFQPAMEAETGMLAELRPSPAFLPNYARQNPSGYSFLCLKELEIENKLPIGVWVKLENPAYLRQQLGNQASLRLKLLRF